MSVRLSVEITIGSTIIKLGRPNLLEIFLIVAASFGLSMGYIGAIFRASSHSGII